MELRYLVLFTALFATSFAEITVRCDESNDDICVVSDVRISPCKANSACLLRKKANATISFDFTPSFSSSELKTAVYWAQDTGDTLFTDFGSDDGCLYTTCPSEAGKKQTFNYNLYVKPKLPQGTFPLKWKVWNKDDNKQLCCFITTIRMRKN